LYLVTGSALITMTLTEEMLSHKIGLKLPMREQYGSTHLMAEASTLGLLRLTPKLREVSLLYV
jgi:hypothetical protein